MKVLVIGSGGREHALVWKIAQSPLVSKLYAAPGNAGTAGLAENVNIKAEDLEGLVNFAEREKIDLTVVGPEIPLVLGIVDRFQERGLKIFGPDRKAAMIEGSKAFAKAFLERHGIPTAAYEVFTEPDKAYQYLEKVGVPIVIKADGLAAGKGAIVCHEIDEARKAIRTVMEEKIFGQSGEKIVIEEYLKGEEASFLAFSDGRSIIPLVTSQDHKQIFDDDQGPNTGGMGAYSPAPLIDDQLYQRIVDGIITPIIEGMSAEGYPYKGVLYVGLIIANGNPKVIECNARLGDPEAQPILARMESDLLPILEGVLEGTLAGMTIRWKEEAAVCVVMAPKGYPGSYEVGKEISGLDKAEALDNIIVFHAGTARKEGKIVTTGGRVLGVTGLGSTISQAIESTYEAVRNISFEGAYYRTDIGRKALTKP